MSIPAEITSKRSGKLRRKIERVGRGKRALRGNMISREGGVNYQKKNPAGERKEKEEKEESWERDDRINVQPPHHQHRETGLKGKKGKRWEHLKQRSNATSCSLVIQVHRSLREKPVEDKE